MHMDDKDIMARITDLIDTEHGLRGQLARGEPARNRSGSAFVLLKRRLTSAGTCYVSAGRGGSTGEPGRCPGPSGVEVEGYQQ